MTTDNGNLIIADMAYRRGFVNASNAAEALLTIEAAPMDYAQCDGCTLLQLLARSLMSGTHYPIEYGMLHDSRDSRDYRTVRLGKQEWMAQNFALSCEDSCAYDNNESLVPTYGRLYTWKSAMDHAPDGWRLPSDADFIAMNEYLGIDRSDCSMLKHDTVNGDDIGFSLLPAGCRQYTGKFDGLHRFCCIWQSNEDKNGRFAQCICCEPNGSNFARYWRHSSRMFSVRYMRSL